jgi:hypothetical protein
MSVTAKGELRGLPIVWISLEDDSLRMTWADGAPLAVRNDVKERHHGR